ncbi:DUF2306 domain-containing protein [Pseudovibrio sp. Tun.PSC04-5.I4]|uniref:DUF2306 domain-containing protein n=1 Tax=Pseudovibrio sp. Tun.PSC04-5.I4 TaxID=1798213 RepID=UPI000889BBE0|nr:DUF2306 domain-containing protein [Pseudovibrio sp. Tun.PSC04-5.I4]SDQ20030.1 Uncharacterized membrane protein [Pseudovibrio sp. Tun.PSC04-5.I4]
MNIAILLDTAAPIPLHAFTAISAFFLGIVQFVLPKGKNLHRILGYTWVGLMAITAGSSFFINEMNLIGPFSPIHILSAITLLGLVGAVTAARTGAVTSHRRAMKSLYIYALLVAGAFTFLPGRIMHQLFFGG